MKLLYLGISVCLFFLSITTGLAQTTVKVSVRDSTQAGPVASAKITAIGESDKPINGLSDNEGYFAFKIVSGQYYELRIGFVGYEPYARQFKALRDTSITIYLKPAIILLSDVKITGDKAIIENRHDRMVYRVSPKLAKGKKITDMMRVIPFVVVTNDEVLIKGNTDYTILKDGNPSNLTIQDLRAMPASRIDSIEIISAPSAQYDGTLKSVINIIFKKNDRFEGGSSFLRAGTRSSSVGASYSNTTATANTNLNVDLTCDRVGSGSDNHTSLFQDTLFDTRQHTTAKNKSPSFSINYGTEWKLSEGQFLGVGAKIGYLGNSTNSFYNSEIAPYNNILVTNNNISTKNDNANVSLNYSKKTGSSSKLNFSNLFDLSQERYNLQSSGSASAFKNKATTNDREFTSQLNYEFVIAKDFKTEAGVKFIDRFYGLSPVYNGTAGDKLDFTQTIGSGYFSVSKSMRRFYVRFGTRFESTNNRFDGGKNSTSNILPNLLTTYDLSKNNTLKFILRKGVARPGFDLLSSFVNRDNPLNTRTGNPSLVNEVFTTFSLEDDLIFGSSNLSISLSYVDGKNQISSKRTIESFVISTVYGNFSKSHSGEAYVSFNTPVIKEKLYFNVSGSLKPYYITDLSQTNKGLIKDLNVGFTVNPSQRLSIDVTANYLGNYIYLQGKSGNSTFTDVMARYQYKNSSFLLQITNPIVNKINQSSAGSGPGFSYSGNNYYLGRGIAIAYAFTFGKSKDEEQKTKNVENNDLKKEKHL